MALPKTLPRNKWKPSHFYLQNKENKERRIITKRRYPIDAILYWDADASSYDSDAFTELTNGPHKFNYNILSPQYQRNADGSYSDVGAKPAVDVFDGEKWLRSCGAVQNLLPSGAENLTSTSWIKRGTAVVAAGNLVSGIAGGGDVYIVKGALTAGVSIGPSIEIKRVSTSGVLAIKNPSDGNIGGRWDVNLALLSDDYELITSSHPAVTIVTNFVVTSGGGCGFHFTYLSGPSPLSFYVRNPQLTATSYPVPYVPPGVTQPASNATTTNGSWFSLPDGSPLWHALDGGPDTDGVELMRESPGLDPGWTNNGDGSFTFTGPAEGNCNIYNLLLTPKIYAKYKVTYRVVSNSFESNRLRTYLGTTISQEGDTSFTGVMQTNTTNTINASIFSLLSGSITIDNISVQRIQPQPLTLATRVRMGVGSGDIAEDGAYNIATPAAGSHFLHAHRRSDGVSQCVSSADGTSTVVAEGTWPRNSIIRRVTQVNTAGTQFRVGYMIEGTHTAIQWGAWRNYDSSFNPSTLYRLMLGYYNAYPMWFSRITAWKEQVSDERILEALNG